MSSGQVLCKNSVRREEDKGGGGVAGNGIGHLRKREAEEAEAGELSPKFGNSLIQQSCERRFMFPSVDPFKNIWQKNSFWPSLDGEFVVSAASSNGIMQRLHQRSPTLRRRFVALLFGRVLRPLANVQAESIDKVCSLWGIRYGILLAREAEFRVPEKSICLNWKLH